MESLDLEGLVLIAVIFYAWLTRRRGLTAIRNLSEENRKKYFKDFGSWRWKHYGMLFLLTALPGLLLWKPDLNLQIKWGICVSGFILIFFWFGLGYNKMITQLKEILDDPDFIKVYFADRLPMGLLYLVFLLIAMQRSHLLPKILF